jgi:hypothetical protein
VPDEPPSSAEDAIAAIAATARQVRRPTPRWVWIMAVVLGLGGLVAFAVVMFGASDASGPAAEVGGARAGGGFGAGLVIGLVAGIAIGVAIARQRGGHSSRSSP